jgi:hypothetical protein
MLVLSLDELGHLGPTVVRTFVPSLFRLATAPGARARVMICLPAKIREFLRDAGLDNPKYGQAFHRVDVRPVDAAGIQKLFGFLSPRARRIATELGPIVAERSRGYPHAVQRLCSELFEAERDGDPDEFLMEVITRGTWDE